MKLQLCTSHFRALFCLEGIAYAVTKEPSSLISGKQLRPLLIKQPSILKTTTSQHFVRTTTKNTPINNVKIFHHLPTQIQKQESVARKHIIVLKTDQIKQNSSETFKLQYNSGHDNTLPDCPKTINSKISLLKPIHVAQPSVIGDTEMISSNKTMTDDTSTIETPANVNASEDAISITDPSCSLDEHLSVTTKKQKTIPKTKVFNPCNIVLVDAVENFKESDVDSMCSGQAFRECMYPCLACGEVFLMKSSLAQHQKTYHGDSLTF